MELCRKTIVLMLITSNAADIFLFTATPPTTNMIAVEAFSVGVSPQSPHSATAGTTTTTTTKWRLFGMTPRRKKDGDDENENNASDSSSFNVNAARSQLEALISNSGNGVGVQQEVPCTVATLLAAVVSTNTDNDENDNDDEDLLQVALPFSPPAVLTAADRDRRLTEIQLLQKLDSSSQNDNDNDDNVVVNMLWDLWYGERGIQGKRRLEETNQLMNDPTRWKECEQILHNMIEEYGIYYYTEPMNRLATLYFLQGRLNDSYKLCRIILHIKPWHFGALSGIVLVLKLLGKQNEAQKWAKQCLPQSRVTSITSFAQDKNGPPNPLRKEWVQRAVQAAQHDLKMAEQRAKESLGEPEEYYKNSSSSSNSNNSEDKSTTLENSEDCAWQ